MQLTTEQLEIINSVKQSNPEISKRRLAQILVQEHPALFPYSPDSLRQFICKYENSFEFAVSAPIVNEVPDSYYEDTPVISIDGKIGVISDLHIPYHDKQAVITTLDYLSKQNLDWLVLNGDIVDFHGLSTFTRDPNKRDLNRELSVANQFLDYIAGRFSNIIYVAGNHEYRFERYVASQAPELWNVEEVSVENFLRLNKRNIRYLDNTGRIEAGKLTILHGDRIAGRGAINVARLRLLYSFNNILTGHDHRTQEYIQKSVDNKMYGSWTTGCLCGLRPQYNPYNNWNHGFAVVEVYKNKMFEVRNFKIVNGSIL